MLALLASMRIVKLRSRPVADALVLRSSATKDRIGRAGTARPI
jgi:hypothetical protein